MGALLRVISGLFGQGGRRCAGKAEAAGGMRSGPGLRAPRPADRLFLSLIERCFIEEPSSQQVVVDRARVAALAKELDGDAGVADALSAFEKLLRHRKLVGQPARSRTHTVEFSSVGDGGTRELGDVGAARDVRGTMVLRLWAVDDRLYIERLSDRRGRWDDELGT